MDLNPGILKRGEGNSEGNVPKYHKTEKLRDLAMEFGDEAALLRYRYPDIPISVGKKRLELAIQLIENHSPDVIVLDDGFQYRQLSRDLDIVLLRESDLKNNWQLPAGPLREPLSALARADFVSVYGNGASRRIEEHGLWNFTVPEVIDHYYQFQGIYRNDTNVTDDYRDRGCNLVSSVARPESLEKYLDGVGFNIVNHIACADHADPTQAVREALSDREYVMVTLKEWVKLDTSLKKKVGLIKSRLTVEPKEVLLDGVKATVALERNCSR
jgi:tetraacyldisaccharide 4'-kinase